ncbi:MULTISPECIES: O-antigen ligase family protein [unclassified Microbacterium]|uniref:O-antigen ligase family protein n=1 Tax=unclassified Microbacterium TaxID=2609290 RepID=UPI00386D065A
MNETRGAVLAFLRSSALASAFAVATIGALFATHAIRQLMGDAGHGAVTTGLCILGAAMLVARRRELRIFEIMPTTLLVLLIWLLASVFWSPSVPATLVGWLQLAGPTFLAVVVAQFRDTLQTVRATGDVLRFLLTASLGVEIMSGILLDGPIPFLGVAGNLAEGGPIQGVFGTRTVLGVVTMIALITFLVEWRTRSVRPGLSLYSIVLAALLGVFTASPIVLGMAAIAGAATATLAVVRRVAPRVRSTLQWTLAGVVGVALLLAYVFRRPLVYWLNAEPDFLTRSRLWNAVLDIAAVRPVQGWGWVGTWPDTLTPYYYIRFATAYHHDSALNAWMDLLLQSGAVGVVLFLAFAGLALARSWMTASERRSTVHVWPALVIITVLADSVVTSSPLGGFGWFLLVVCATRASLLRGWRHWWSSEAAPSGIPRREPPQAAPDGAA